jgi:hypothetical protein
VEKGGDASLSNESRILYQKDQVTVKNQHQELKIGNKMSAYAMALLASATSFGGIYLSRLGSLWFTKSQVLKKINLALPILSLLFSSPQSLGEVRAFGAMVMIAIYSWRRVVNEHILGISQIFDTQSVLGVLFMLVFSFRFSPLQILAGVARDLSAGSFVVQYILSATAQDYIDGLGWAIFNVGPKPERPEATAALFACSAIGTVIGLVGWSWSRGLKHGAIQEALEPFVMQGCAAFSFEVAA